MANERDTRVEKYVRAKRGKKMNFFIISYRKIQKHIAYHFLPRLLLF